jgi:hypothetical protein
MDEKGFVLGTSQKETIIIRVNHRHVDRQRRFPGNRDFITVVETVGVTDGLLKPLIIFKGVTAPIFYNPRFQRDIFIYINTIEANRVSRP